MSDNGELHVVFGTGAVGMSVMDELIRRDQRRVRMVNRSGRASVPDGEAVRDCFWMNKSFRAWGHQFLYNFQIMMDWKLLGSGEVNTGLEARLANALALDAYHGI